MSLATLVYQLTEHSKDFVLHGASKFQPDKIECQSSFLVILMNWQFYLLRYALETIFNINLNFAWPKMAHYICKGNRLS